MIRPFAALFRRIAALIPEGFRREDGTAAMEFVLVIPVVMMIFMASFESGLLMIRAVMLERAVDMTMGELRLGHYPAVTNQLLKREICARTVVFANCTQNMKIEMDRVSTTTWNFPATPNHCINRRAEAEPVVTYTTPTDKDLMFVRVCVVLQAMFPSSGLALSLPIDADGGYGLITRTAFVVEPS